MTEEKLKMIEPIYDSFENEDIKDFCKLLVSELPLYWWEVPASSTGKYLLRLQASTILHMH